MSNYKCPDCGKIAWKEPCNHCRNEATDSDSSSSLAQELEREEAPRINMAKELGWTSIGYVYDDTRDGIYLGGVNPDGKRGRVPALQNMPNVEKEEKL